MNDDINDLPIRREALERGLLAFASGWGSSFFRQSAIPDPTQMSDGLIFFGDSAAKKAFIRALPSAAGLRHLWVRSLANQALFDAVCHVPTLLRIDFEATSISNCDAVEALASCTHFSISNSRRLSSFAPVTRMKSLTSLSIRSKFASITRIPDLGALASLRGLTLSGRDYHSQNYESLEPLAELKDLQLLDLFRLNLANDDARPLTRLTALEYLFLDKRRLSGWSVATFRMLYEKLPRLRNKLIERAATDREFQTKYRIR